MFKCSDLILFPWWLFSTSHFFGDWRDKGYPTLLLLGLRLHFSGVSSMSVTGKVLEGVFVWLVIVQVLSLFHCIVYRHFWTLLDVLQCVTLLNDLLMFLTQGLFSVEGISVLKLSLGFGMMFTIPNIFASGQGIDEIIANFFDCCIEMIIRLLGCTANVWSVVLVIGFV